MHSDAVHDRGIALFNEPFGNFPSPVCDLAKAGSGRNDTDIVLNLIISHTVERFLISRGLAGAAPEGSRKVRIVAVTADCIGVQGHQLPGLTLLPLASLNQGFVR